MNLTVRPLDDATWPGPFTADDDREPSRFKASWKSTLDLLGREVDHAVHGRSGARLWHGDAVLEVPFPATRIYKDGTGVHADARAPRHPGVALSFDLPEVGPVRFATDRYKGTGWGQYLPDWQANVRAIALGLEALRSVDRYGITRKAEQYRGWNALGTGDDTPTPMGPGQSMSREDAARLLWERGGAVGEFNLLRASAHASSLFRVAARIHHPDAGGDPAEFQRIVAARDLLTGGT